MDAVYPQIAHAYLTLLYLVIVLIVAWTIVKFITEVRFNIRQFRIRREITSTPNDFPRQYYDNYSPTAEKHNSNPFDFESYHSREFVNQPIHKSPAAISVGIEDGSYNVEIFDCTGSILLHGFLGKRESVENALYKFDKLIDVLQKGRRHIAYQAAIKMPSDA